MSASKPLSWQFDDAAQLYDEVRSRYPEEIVEHIIACAALPAHGRIFELGCGTGQMTLSFAKRGYAMVAIDQGERLAALAATHCVPYPQVRVVACAFEAWQARYARTKQIAVFCRNPSGDQRDGRGGDPEL